MFILNDIIQGGAHPGLRVPNEGKKGQASTPPSEGGNKGMMGVVLPLYAVGIVLYLVYTIIKVS